MKTKIEVLIYNEEVLQLKQNMIFITDVSSGNSGEPVHMLMHGRAFAARKHKAWKTIMGRTNGWTPGFMFRE